MKIKKRSVAAIFMAVLLIAGVATVFATSASGSTKKADTIPNTDFTDEEYEKLLALQFDGYEDMTVSEYQRKAWELTDTVEYKELLERFAQDENLYEQKDSNEIASFLFYILEPLTAERWQSRNFGGYTSTEFPSPQENAALEYNLTLTILNADTLTLREYQETREGFMEGLQSILKGKTREQLKDEVFMDEAIEMEIDRLMEQLDTGKLQAHVDYFFIPLTSFNGSDYGNAHSEEQEQREYPNGTKEDYRSLLTLKIPEFQNMSLADFNSALLDWANDNYDAIERISNDTAWDDIQVSLSGEELSFVTLTVSLSNAENTMFVRSSYTGEPQEAPSFAKEFQKEEAVNGGAAWCSLYYQFTYAIPDKEAITVGERDHCVGSFLNGVQMFWENTSLDELLEMTGSQMAEELKRIAEQYSNQSMTIQINEDQVSFEGMDERDVLQE